MTAVLLSSVLLPISHSGTCFFIFTVLSTVVFGRVIEGMDVVKRMEANGSSSGKTKQKVVIADCGEV